MKIDCGFVDMTGTFFIKDSSERRKITDSPHSCGKFLLLKALKVSGLILKRKNPMPNKEFFYLNLIRFVGLLICMFSLKETLYAVILFNVSSTSMPLRCYGAEPGEAHLVYLLSEDTL